MLHEGVEEVRGDHGTGVEIITRIVYYGVKKQTDGTP